MTRSQPFIRYVKLLMMAGLLAIATFSATHEHVVASADASIEHSVSDYDGSHPETPLTENCRVHATCKLTAGADTLVPAQDAPLVTMLSKPLHDRMAPSVLTLTETPPPRA